jgi:transposase
MGKAGIGKRDFDGLERRRMEAAGMLHRGIRQAEVARHLKVSRESVRRWADQIARHGSAKILKKAGRAGRKGRLDAAELAKLETILKSGPEKAGFSTGLWTLDRIGQVIRKEFQVEYHSGHVWWILHKKLGWSCQRPAGRARERNESAIAEWKQSTWPALKKSPKRRPDDHLRRRKRTEPASASGPDLVQTRGYPGAAAPVQLGQPVHGSRHHHVAVLLPPV